MLKYQSWQTKQGRFLSMTGITVEEFNNLVPHFVEAHDDYFSKYSLDGKARKVRVKATIYSNSPLPCHEERLAFILSYLKNNPTQEYHADLFDMEQRHCNLFVHSLHKILDSAMETLKFTPATNQLELDEKLEELPEEKKNSYMMELKEKCQDLLIMKHKKKNIVVKRNGTQ
jgi:hypothetical protein